VDLKQTINLPRTNFSMKANLPQAEPKMLARWAAEDLYGQIRKVARKGKPSTSCTTGRLTPTAASTSAPRSTRSSRISS
jgi:isoleucyl-tRNA synthetase